MTANQNAREFLDYYIDLDGDPEFAVLLEGPWGSGKSHFVDAYFRERLAKSRATDADAIDPLIRVTLFGVHDLSDITTQMFEKAHPILGGKVVRLLNHIGSKLAGLAKLNLSAKENATLLQDMVLNLKGRILVFDDLERSPLPLVEIMGFINRFVEHDKLKVIVVASEQDIPEDQQQEYKARKEKLVGKTIKVGSDPAEVLGVFSKRLKLAEALKAIDDNRDKLLATFCALGRPNFRSLRAIILDFERLASLVDPRLRSSKAAMSQLLLYLVALGVEFRGNTLDDAGLRNLQSDIRFRLKLGAGRNEDSKEQVRAADLRQRYEHVSFDDPIVRPEHLADLFSSGSIDVAAVNEHLCRHPAVVGQAEVPAWRLMWGWSELPETDYRTARARFITDLTGRKMTHPGQILHAAGSTLHLKRYGDNLISGKLIIDYFTEYIAEIETAHTLEPVTSLSGPMGNSYAGLVYAESDTPDFMPMRVLVTEASARALKLRMQATAPVLLARLQADPHNGSMLHEWGLEKKNYAGVAILNYIPVSAFADLMLIDRKPNDQLLAALNQRYRQGHDVALQPELEWRKQLSNELMKRADALSPPYGAFAKQRLAYWSKDHGEQAAGKETAES